MSYRISLLRGLRIVATDGPAGVLNDVYLEERGWGVRYLAVDRGERQVKRRVLVAATVAAPPENGAIALEVACAELREAPSGFDPRLLSAREVAGYRIEARDGTLGRLDDLLIDEASWSLAGVVAATRDWLLPGRRVELAAAAITGVDRAGRRLRVNLRRSQMGRSV